MTQTLEATIQQVTVFTDRAQVLKKASLELSKGFYQLAFAQISSNLDEDSIQVNGFGNAIIKDIKFETFYTSTTSHNEEEVQQLFAEKKKIEQQILPLQKKIELVKHQQEFVKNIGSKVTNSNTQNETDQLDPAKWLQMIELYRTQLSKGDEELLALEAEIGELKARIVQIQKQINSMNVSEEQEQNQVLVQLEVVEDGEVSLELSYIVYQASWYPLYDFRVNSESKKVTISYYGVVAQSTGENWQNARLKLSTARPQVSGKQPELSPWFVSVYVPQPMMEKSGFAKSKKKSRERMVDEEANEIDADFMVGSIMEEPVMASMEKPKVKVETGANAVFFNIDSLYTIKSDNTDHKVNILSTTFEADLHYTSVPKLSPFAYLRANITNESDFPLLAGEANVFLDNHFIAKSNIKTIAPTEEVELSLGIDESIKVEKVLLKKYEKKEGLFTKKKRIVYEYEIKVKNFKNTAQKITISDQIPISQNQEITIELLQPHWKEDTQALKKTNQNYLEWHFELPAGEEKKLPFEFAIEHPREIQIVGL